jgi:YVTN family beta-propeller protein
VLITDAMPFAYVKNNYDNMVSTPDSVDNTITATINVKDTPVGIAISPDGTKEYVMTQNWSRDYCYGNVSVINTATNTVIATVPLGDRDLHEIAVSPDGITVTPDGKKYM